MKISGVKYLDENNYKNLFINDDMDGFKVNVHGNAKQSEFLEDSANFVISDELKNLDDNKAKALLIDYFITNNRINKISSVYDDYYEKGVIKVGSGKKKMKAILRNPLFVDEETNKILNKYNNDRIKFLYENDFDEYEIETSKRYSSYYTDNVCGKQICYLFLKSENKKPLLMEQYFIKDFVEYKISKQEKKATIDEDYIYYKDGYLNVIGNCKYTFRCGDFTIITNDDNIYLLLKEIAKNHNLELEEAEQMQYRIKGF